MERTNPVRLLLLPIPRATLYLAQAAGALAEPWTLVLLPIAICLPLGLAVGGALAAAAMALIAGLTFVVVLLGLSTLTSSIVQIVVRDRRRGELIALAFILLLPLARHADQLLRPGPSRRHRTGQSAPVAGDLGAVGARSPGAFSPLPVGALRRGATRPPWRGARGPASPHGWRWPRLPPSSTARRSSPSSGSWRFPGSVARRRSSGRQAGAGWRLPLLSPGASAVAIAQIRLTMRTPRGRSTLLSPLMLCICPRRSSPRAGAGVFR